jgi:hypothetical protein
MIFVIEDKLWVDYIPFLKEVKHGYANKGRDRGSFG